MLSIIIFTVYQICCVFTADLAISLGDMLTRAYGIVGYIPVLLGVAIVLALPWRIKEYVKGALWPSIWTMTIAWIGPLGSLPWWLIDLIGGLTWAALLLIIVLRGESDPLPEKKNFNKQEMESCLHS